MDATDLLVDAFGRVADTVRAAVADLSEAELAVRLDPEANSIAWLVWHLTRDREDFAAVAGLLAADVVRPDLRGFGASDKNAGCER